ncbi:MULTISPECIES: MmyB family transcriptional regulator [Microbacterium]|uniref:MmyB family transcriptional regulator n=1 Tax=Microbacterium TaxID=33882 RepID=UPI0011EB9B38|nr:MULTISPECIES: helix-turn-helix domain-containing protein [Microbacterium]
MSEHRHAVAEYLRARRAVLQPEDVGLPRLPGRRVEGLRREEVAALARISAEYYVRLERGHDHQPSDQVLLALAQALRLDDDATAYLLRLNSGGLRTSVPRTPREQKVPASVHALLQHLSHTPAIVIDGNQDVLAGNAIAKALQPESLQPGKNLLLATFDVSARDRVGETWFDLATRITASFRLRSDPDDPRFRELLARLLIQDPDFPAIWARHDVRELGTDVTRHRIEPFGLVDVCWQHLRIPSTDLVVVMFANPPGSPAAAAIRYLAETLRLSSS